MKTKMPLITIEGPYEDSIIVNSDTINTIYIDDYYILVVETTSRTYKFSFPSYYYAKDTLAKIKDQLRKAK